MGYDEWLEKPYHDRAAQDELYEKFCEGEGLDPDLQSTQDAFEERMKEG